MCGILAFTAIGKWREKEKMTSRQIQTQAAALSLQRISCQRDKPAPKCDSSTECQVALTLALLAFNVFQVN